MTTLTQLDLTNDGPILQNKRARLLIVSLLAAAALTACGGNLDSPRPDTAAAAPPPNTVLAAHTETKAMTAKASIAPASGPGTTSAMDSSDTSGTLLTYGSTYHIKNNYANARNTYLDTRGRACEYNWLCVSTAWSNNRDRDSGNWTILSAQGKAKGTAVMVGDLVYLANKYTEATSADLVTGPFGGFLDVRGANCQGNALCVSTSGGSKRDGASGTWKIEGGAGPVYSEQNIQLKNGYDGSYLDTRGWSCADNALCVSTSTSANRDSGSGTWRFEIIDIGASGTVRHIYNLTNQSWYFAIQPDRGYSQTDCPGAWTRSDRVTECSVPPNTTVSFAYVDAGWVALQRSGGIAKSWRYNTNFYILHDGSTPGVNLNDPANGDMQLFGSMEGVELR